ncbi:MAG: hypothetical protein BWX80_03906 [Candidatus Hydrogenedentes bacterium ADurb.Bin101]|nr:MAG: hypothetical protein BWX80_03906 [Candidatus Hydrogenedentes bacterium ADurb.Bin101]
MERIVRQNRQRGTIRPSQCKNGDGRVRGPGRLDKVLTGAGRIHLDLVRGGTKGIWRNCAVFHIPAAVEYFPGHGPGTPGDLRGFQRFNRGVYGLGDTFRQEIGISRDRVALKYGSDSHARVGMGRRSQYPVRRQPCLFLNPFLCGLENRTLYQAVVHHNQGQLCFSIIQDNATRMKGVVYAGGRPITESTDH